MKKNKALLLGLLVLPLLASCSEIIVKPRRNYPGDPIENKEQFEETNMTVYFYLSYSNSEEPLCSMKWYMLKPLEKCPEEATKAVQDAVIDGKIDPLYPHFLGWSEYSSSIDESKIWNFETDYKQSNILNLYGIWVSDGEVE